MICSHFESHVLLVSYQSEFLEAFRSHTDIRKRKAVHINLPVDNDESSALDAGSCKHDGVARFHGPLKKIEGKEDGDDETNTDREQSMRRREVV
jgi:hypothetical protein